MTFFKLPSLLFRRRKANADDLERLFMLPEQQRSSPVSEKIFSVSTPQTENRFQAINAEIIPAFSGKTKSKALFPGVFSVKNDAETDTGDFRETKGEETDAAVLDATGNMEIPSESFSEKSKAEIDTGDFRETQGNEFFNQPGKFSAPSRQIRQDPSQEKTIRPDQIQRDAVPNAESDQKKVQFNQIPKDTVQNKFSSREKVQFDQITEDAVQDVEISPDKVQFSKIRRDTVQNRPDSREKVQLAQVPGQSIQNLPIHDISSRVEKGAVPVVRQVSPDEMTKSFQLQTSNVSKSDTVSLQKQEGSYSEYVFQKNRQYDTPVPDNSKTYFQTAEHRSGSETKYRSTRISPADFEQESEFSVSDTPDRRRIPNAQDMSFDSVSTERGRQTDSNNFLQMNSNLNTLTNYAKNQLRYLKKNCELLQSQNHTQTFN